MKTQTDDHEVTDELTTEEVLGHFEFGLWTAVFLIPILYWINGPSVSNDQLVMRTILCVFAYVGAPSITLWRRLGGKKSAQKGEPNE